MAIAGAGLDDLSLESPASPHDLRLPGVMTFHPALQAAVPRLEVPSHRIQGGGSGYLSSQQNIQGQSRRFCTVPFILAALDGMLSMLRTTLSPVRYIILFRILVWFLVSQKYVTKLLTHLSYHIWNDRWAILLCTVNSIYWVHRVQLFAKYILARLIQHYIFALFDHFWISLGCSVGPLSKNWGNGQVRELIFKLGLPEASTMWKYRC